MSRKAYSSTAAVIFSLITVGHLLRLALRVPWVVADQTIPMWPSLVGVLVAGFMAYQGFRLRAKE